FLWSCFCSSCRPHRSLHSFPTRRSSDLFASVAAIVCGMRRLAPAAPAGSWRARLRNAALVSPCALVGTAPLTAFHFHQVSLVGLVANPLTIPIFGSVVVVLGLAGAVLEPVAPPAAAALFRTAGLVLWPGIALVRALAKPAWAAASTPGRRWSAPSSGRARSSASTRSS